MLDRCNYYRLRRVINGVYYRLKFYNDIVITYKHPGTVDHKLVHSDPAIDIVKVTNNNVEDALNYEPYFKVQKFKQFLASGDRGYYAYLNGAFAHRSWVTFGPKTVRQWYFFCPLELKEDEAYIHYCETVPFARGRGIYPIVLNKIVKDLHGQASNVYISTIESNIASRKGIKKAGFIEIRRQRVIGVFGMQYVKECKARLQI